MIRRPPRSTPLYSSAASDVYKRQASIQGGIFDALQKFSLGLFTNTILTRDQVIALKKDNVTSKNKMGFKNLGIVPTACLLYTSPSPRD